MVEVSLTVGKLDASLALLLTKDHHLIEFPTILLPDGINAGSVVTIKCEKDAEQEKQNNVEFENVQNTILELYGTREPTSPVLKVKNVTQTSIILEWEDLELGSSTIKSLTLYKNGVKLGHIPKPLVTKTTKLSGLAIDTEYEFFLRLETTAGVFDSNNIKLKTHKMTDLSGITVCVGQLEEGITIEQISVALNNIGAKALQTEVKVDTTHFITTEGKGPQWQRAIDNNIPVVRPEWLKACELERRIVGVRDFYLDSNPKFLELHRFNKEGTGEPVQGAESVTEPASTETESATEGSKPTEVSSSAPETVSEAADQQVNEIQEDLEEIDINETQENLPEETTEEPKELPTPETEEAKDVPTAETEESKDVEIKEEAKKEANLEESAEGTKLTQELPESKEEVKEPATIKTEAEIQKSPAEEASKVVGPDVEEPKQDEPEEPCDIVKPEAKSEEITEKIPIESNELEQDHEAEVEEDEGAEEEEDTENTAPAPNGAKKSKKKNNKKKGKKK